MPVNLAQLYQNTYYLLRLLFLDTCLGEQERPICTDGAVVAMSFCTAEDFKEFEPKGITVIPEAVFKDVK